MFVIRAAPDLGGPGPPTMFMCLAICTTCACHLLVFISEESLFVNAIKRSVVLSPDGSISLVHCIDIVTKQLSVILLLVILLFWLYYC